MSDSPERYAKRAAANDESLNTAAHHNEPWSGDEDDLLRVTFDEPIADVALVLGRTIFAVDMRRSLVRRNLDNARSSWGRVTRQPDYGSKCESCGLIHRGGC